ncbi:hypothetical protein FRC10_000506 [Ceratobasidium sp. 414]|nr:hypothetical protein FRC10_000506 [Ceratobasidium sp. 414]
MATITQPTDPGASITSPISHKEGATPRSLPSSPTPKPQSATTGPDPVAPPTATFVFGFPRYSVSNTQLGDAAAAVLREMNARMGVSTSSQALSLEQLVDVMAGKTSAPAPVRVGNGVDTRFGNQHEKEIAKMDSIANHYSVTSRANKRKSQHSTSSTESNPNTIFTLPPHIVAPPALPERSAKRARMSAVNGEEPAQPSAPSTSAVEDKVLRDSAVVRANLERKRRSSAARASLAGRKSPGGPRKSAPRQPPPPSGSRFGFVGRIVRRVWGGGSKKEKEKKKDEKGKAKENPHPWLLPQRNANRVSVLRRSSLAYQPRRLCMFPTSPPRRRRSSPPLLELGCGGQPHPPIDNSEDLVLKPVAEDKKSSGTTRGGVPELGAAGARPRPGSIAGNSVQTRTGSINGVTISECTRPSSTLLAPTAASLARQGTVASKATGASKPSAIPTASKPAATTKLAARLLPVPPTGVARAATSGAAVAPSARMASPPVRASSVASSAGRGALSPTAGARSPTTATRKSVVSPLAGWKSTITRSLGIAGAGAGSKSQQSIFKTPLTIDAVTMRGSAPTIQPFRLSPRANISVAPVPPAATTAAASPKLVIKPTTATRSTDTTVSRTQCQPRISHSKVIARLEEKRAAAAIANKPPALFPVSKARSSARIRRSMGAIAARKALDADMDRRARLRKSEAARRKSKVPPALGLGRR